VTKFGILRLTKNGKYGYFCRGLNWLETAVKLEVGEEIEQLPPVSGKKLRAKREPKL